MNIIQLLSSVSIFILITTHMITAQNVNGTNATTTAPSNTSTAENNNNSSSSGNNTSVCTRSGLTCLDCRTLQHCENANDSRPTFTVTCAVQTSNQNPYCSMQLNQCVSQNTCLQTQVPLLACSQLGRHPDPMNCRQYIQCTQENNTFVGYPVECPSNLHFNQKTELCDSSACLEMPRYCNSKPGKIVAYQPYPNMYGKCPDKGSSNTYIPIAMCKGQYAFNEKTGNCEPKCLQVGNIPSNENCHAYYSCGQGFLTGFTIVLNNCPSNFGYNPITQLCDTAYNNCTNINEN